MSTPLLTPGEGGGKPAKPESEESQSYLPYPEPVPTAYDPLSSIRVPEPSPIQTTTQNPRPYDPLSSIRGPEPVPRPYDPLSSIQAPAGQTSIVIMPDVANKRDITEADVLKYCEYICEADEAVFAGVMNILEGFDPDDEERTVRERVNKHLRLLGLNDYITPAEAYSIPLNSVFSPRLAGNAGMIVATDPFAEFLPDPSALNKRTVKFLQEEFPDINLRTREELQAFFQSRLGQLVPEFDDPEIGWDDFNTQELIAFYYSALKLAMEMYSIPYDHHYMGEERAAVAGELGFVEGLIEKAAKTPLEDLDALLEAYSWDSEADALFYLRHRVEDVYVRLSRELPAGWDRLDDPVVMANMLFDAIEEIKSLSFQDSPQYPDELAAVDWGRIANPFAFVSEEPKTLTGTHQPPPDLTLFLFIGSLFFEPLDWVLTAIDVIEAIEEGDLGAALGNAILGLLPFVPGSADDLIRYGTDIAGKAWQAGDEFVTAAGIFAGRFNNFNLAIADEIFDKLQKNKKFENLTPSELVQIAKGKATSSNSKRLRAQFNWAVKHDRYRWEWRAPKPGQDAHHIVPSGDSTAQAARDHMESLGISVNSAHNGVGLQRSVHGKTGSTRYVTAINKAVRKFHDKDELVGFLDSAARDLHNLNQYAGNPELLASKFNEFLSKIEEVSQ